jgi:phosphopantothenoylcysteine synthetase/decarboxylase
MKILMLITGGIAAHKTPSIASALSLYGHHDVHIMTTQNALKFVTKDSLMYSAKRWRNNEYMGHIKVFNDGIDKMIVIPATANIIGKIAHGIGDDEVSATCIKCSSQVIRILFPSMNTDMWNNSIVQDNIEKLLLHGWCVVDPEYGQMACGVEGKGVLPKTNDIVKCVNKIVSQKNILIKNNIPSSYWYAKYSGQQFRIFHSEDNNNFIINHHVDDNRLIRGSGSRYYYVRKEDADIIYLTDLNRIKDCNFLGEGYIV